jgi:RNA polymerase sigma-70 factor, ECF subfamily
VTSLAVRHQLPPSERDSEGAGRLFAEYSGCLLRYCFRQLGSRAEAEDAVQTTFLYALRALQRGVVPECESAWLHTIAKNVCRWQRRTIARRGALSSDVALDGLAAVEPRDARDEELRLEIRETLAAIPERQRVALLLREWQGLSSREIATRLGMSVTETYALVTRARHSFKRAMTASTRRPALSINFGPLLLRLKGLFLGGNAASAVTATAVVASIALGGGVLAERAIRADPSHPPPAPKVVLGPSIGAAAGGSAAVTGPPRETAVSAATTAKSRASRDNPVPASSLPGSAATPIANPSGPSDIPAPASDPRPPDSAAPAAGSGADELPNPAPVASPVPGVEPLPRADLAPPAELPGDVPPLPQLNADLPVEDPASELPGDVPPLPQLNADLPVEDPASDPPAPPPLPDLALPEAPTVP